MCKTYHVDEKTKLHLVELGFTSIVSLYIVPELLVVRFY